MPLLDKLKYFLKKVTANCQGINEIGYRAFSKNNDLESSEALQNSERWRHHDQEYFENQSRQNDPIAGSSHDHYSDNYTSHSLNDHTWRDDRY